MYHRSFPKTSLGFFPTPIMELSRFSDILDGPRIFIKRDDMTGLALGGNKTRKLEYILADAITQGCDSIITAGAAQSGFGCGTMRAAASCDLESLIESSVNRVSRPSALDQQDRKSCPRTVFRPLLAVRFAAWSMYQ